MDTYETLMLHDYGFYQFEKFRNYTQHKDVCDYLKPLFENRDQFVAFDESSQIISACMQYYELRIKNKSY